LSHSKNEPAVWFPAIRAGTGADVYTETLAKGLQQRGIRAEITWLPHRAEYAPWTVAVPQPPSWANIAHVNTWMPNRFLPKGLPYVTCIHSCVHTPSLKPYKSYLKRLYHRLWVKSAEQNTIQRATRVIAVSQFIALQASKVFGCRNIEVIHNGVDTRIFHPIRKQRTTCAPFCLLFVGKQSRLKGFDMLVPIMESLGKAFELHFTTGRGGNDNPRNLPASFHPIGCLTTPGMMAQAYQNADALIFPTRLEGFGLVALEAQACGLPVIATHGSSLPEVVQDGETGFLCPQDDLAAFTAAARRLAADPCLWQYMSEAAHARAEANFGIDAMIDRYVALYRAALDTPY
jgi:glycosyltransferase involved in cell wall biosynthesis